jgi:DNA N-6-adenine-methyltransferase (Dam)
VRSAATRFSNELRYRPGDHPSQCQLTPAYALDPVRETLGGVIGLDPCTTADNPVGALRYICPPADGAAEPWPARTIFVNPPYSKARERWVRRCAQAGADGSRVILLIPAATDTRIFQDALKTASAMVLIRGRLKFGVLRPNRRQAAASHPSALIGWNTGLAPCAHLGFGVLLDREGS